MGIWQVTFRLSTGRDLSRLIEATAKHTGDGYVRFVQWPPGTRTSGPWVVWARPENDVVDIEQDNDSLRDGRRPDESVKDWLSRAQQRHRQVQQALEELEHAAGLDREVAPGQPYPTITAEIMEVSDLADAADADLSAATEAVRSQRW